MDNFELIKTIQDAANNDATTLDLGGNQLTSLPPEIGQLTNLQELDISANELTDLPPEIIHLTRLQALNVSENRLTFLPRGINRLTNLQELDVSANELTVFPPEITHLDRLQILKVSKNHLKVLPPEIGQLSNLRELDVSANELTVLPPEIALFTRLQVLDVNENELTSPPPEIVRQGTQSVFAFLREMLGDIGIQWVSKLVLVGEGGAGKTALLHALRGNTFDQLESTTSGIEISSLELNHPTEPNVTMRLNVWDFGGQAILRATHQLYLTDRSLFLLVWNARSGFEQGNFQWLDTIHSRAPDSPILIIATHIDQRKPDISLNDIKTRYPQVIGHCAVSNMGGIGIEDARLQIRNAAAELPRMGERLPVSWLRVADTIREKTEVTITGREMRQLMADQGVHGDTSNVLAQWLHDLGEILYFADDEDLNDTVFLDLEWVTENIGKVLESDQISANFGMFTRYVMEGIWSDINPALQDNLVRLMEKFGLLWTTAENRDISIVVEQLPFDPPKNYEKTWDEIKQKPGAWSEISMNYRFDGLLPAGVPSWFIARSHRFTTGTHWRNGAIFADGNDRTHLALIEADPYRRSLRLSVRGPYPQNFFALLRDGLESTLARFPGLSFQRFIPCPGHDGTPCIYEFDREQVERAITRRLSEIQCPESFERVSVATLLFGLFGSSQSSIGIEFDGRSGFYVGRSEILSLKVTNLSEETNIGFELELDDTAKYSVSILEKRHSLQNLKPSASRVIDFPIVVSEPGTITLQLKLDGKVFNEQVLEIQAVEDNPYFYGPPVRGAQNFLGRDAELQAIMNNVMRHSGAHTMVIGEQRSGKTSLIYQVQDRLQAPYIPIYISLSGIERDDKEALVWLLYQILGGLKTRNIAVEDYDTITLRFSTDFTRTLEDIVRLIKQDNPDRKLVLLLDEAHLMSELDVKFQEVLREAFNYLVDDVRVVLACYYGFFDGLRVSGSPLQNIFEYLFLKPLKGQELTNLISNPALRFGYQFDDDAQTAIRSISGGHPYYCQYLCARSFAEARLSESQVISYSHVKAAEQQVLANDKQRFKLGYWDNLGQEERSYLNALILGESTANTQKGIINRLRNKFIIADKDGSTEFTASLFEQWTKQLIDEDSGSWV